MSSLNVQDTSSSTKEIETSLITREEERLKEEVHQSTPTETELIAYVNKRFGRMQSARSRYERDWQIFQRMWEASYVPYADGRSRSVVPLLHALFNVYYAEALKRRTDFTYSGATQEYDNQATLLDRLHKYDWSREFRNQEIDRDEHGSSVFGTGIMYTGFEMRKTIIKDISGDDISDDGSINYKRKMRTEGKILVKSVDIRDVYFDERANRIEDAVDCVYITRMSVDEFENLRHNKFYKNTEGIVGGASAPAGFTVQNQNGQNFSDNVELMHYWNKDSDDYIVIANKSVIIRQSPNMTPSKRLPFVVRQFFSDPLSLYGKGFGHVAMTFNSELNTLREMLMEAVKRSNSQVVAIGGNLLFDSANTKFHYGNQIMQFQGDLGPQNFQQLSGNPPNSSIFSYIDKLMEDLAMYTGIDVRGILGDSAPTAYQASAQRDSALKRVNVILANRDSAYQRLAELHKDNLQFYYPIKLVRKLVDVDEEGKSAPVEGEYPSMQLEDERIDDKGRIRRSPGIKDTVELTPEKIRGDVCVTARTNMNIPTIHEVEKEQTMQFFSQIPSLLQNYQLVPELEGFISKKESIAKLAGLYNIPVKSAAKQEIEEAKSKLKADLEAMLAQTQGGNLGQGTPEAMQQIQEQTSSQLPSL